ncbi:MAG: hypothetical protein R3300_14200 [Candidatus Promineifilaceae bacterium]|nr:hypothetical protein [Candidatus Promineifilaceae bacterium]
MKSSLQELLNSRIALSFAMWLARRLPPGPGYRLCDWVGEFIAGRRNTAIVQAVRANKWVASRERLVGAELDASVAATFRWAARSVYETYHYLGDTEKMEARAHINQPFQGLMSRIEAAEEGTVLAVTHTGNFDFFARVAARHGFAAWAVTAAQPGGGYQQQNRMRDAAGLRTLPASLESIRMSTDHLLQGGTVVTGADRPIEAAKYRPQFFGRPANLPVHYVSLALKTDAPIIAASVFARDDGVYTTRISEPIYMERPGGRRANLLHNAERVLKVVETFIEQELDQWLMFYPVWPEALSEVPR